MCLLCAGTGKIYEIEVTHLLHGSRDQPEFGGDFERNVMRTECS